MQHFKIFSLPMIVLIICCFFLIAYNLHNDSYEFFFDDEPFSAVELKIKSADIIHQSTFGNKSHGMKVQLPESQKTTGRKKFKQISFIK